MTKTHLKNSMSFSRKRESGFPIKSGMTRRTVFKIDSSLNKLSDNHFQVLLKKFLFASSVSQEDSVEVAQSLAGETISPVQQAALLCALTAKGIDSPVLTGFALALRSKMIPVNTTSLTMDTCGTGGDGKGTFNISTATALVVSACGIPVAKHGNRGVSSICGSADVLEALGANINVSALHAEKILKKCGFVFLFAPLFHPAMKSVAGVRKELGVPTIFNFLGPLLNPARPQFQVIGTTSVSMAHQIALAISSLGISRALVLSSQDGTDEASAIFPTVCFYVQKRKVTKKILDPHKFGFKKTSPQDLKGGNSSENAQIITSILGGEKGIKRDTVVLNSALAIALYKQIQLEKAICLANETIDSGKGMKKLQEYIYLSNHL